jgi:Tfp pilus assembly protein PilN
MPPVSSSAGAIPIHASTDAPTMVLNPTASAGGDTGGTAGTSRRRRLWIPVIFAVLVCVLAIVGLGLLRAGDLPSALGA